MTSETKAAGRSRVQCLDRALDILEALAQREEMGVSEIARALGLHVATIHNLLSTLAARHYLLNVNGRYRIGPGLAVLASQWNPGLALPGRVRPALEDLTQSTGESAVATALAGGQAVMFARTFGLNDVTVQFPNAVWPCPLDLATGRVLVAHLQEHQRALYLREGAAAPAGRPAAGWEAEFRHIRERGVCVLGGARRSVLALGAPVFGPGGRVLVALGVSCPQFRAALAHRKRLEAALVRAANGLSAELGGAQAAAAGVLAAGRASAGKGRAMRTGLSQRRNHRNNKGEP